MAAAPHVWVQPATCFGFAASWAGRTGVHLPYRCQGAWASVFSTGGSWEAGWVWEAVAGQRRQAGPLLHCAFMHKGH